MQPISRDLNALKMPLLQRWARKAFARRQVTLDGAKFNLASGHIPGGVKRAMWRGDYELEERAILNRIVKPQDRVLEGGAGMGVASMSVANIVGSKNLVSYEASPATYALLQANIELNGQSFKTVNKALAGTAGSVRFDTGSNLLSQSIVSDSASTSQQSELQADALDDVLAEFAPNTLVLDVEGAEYPMLAESDLSGVEKIIVEIHPGILGPEKVSALLAALLAKGFFLDVENSLKRVFTFFR